MVRISKTTPNSNSNTNTPPELSHMDEVQSWIRTSEPLRQFFKTLERTLSPSTYSTTIRRIDSTLRSRIQGNKRSDSKLRSGILHAIAAIFSAYITYLIWEFKMDFNNRMALRWLHVWVKCMEWMNNHISTRILDHLWVNALLRISVRYGPALAFTTKLPIVNASWKRALGAGIAARELAGPKLLSKTFLTQFESLAGRILIATKQAVTKTSRSKWIWRKDTLESAAAALEISTGMSLLEGIRFAVLLWVDFFLQYFGLLMVNHSTKSVIQITGAAKDATKKFWKSIIRTDAVPPLDEPIPSSETQTNGSPKRSNSGTKKTTSRRTSRRHVNIASYS